MQPALDARLKPLPLAVVLRGLADLAKRDRPLRAAGQRALIGRHITDDLAEGDRDDREIIGAKP